MDPQTAFNAIVSLASIFGGIVLKSIYDAIKDLRREDGGLHDRLNKLPEVYIRRDDFVIFAHEIKSALTRIEDKLDHKVDK